MGEREWPTRISDVFANLKVQRVRHCTPPTPVVCRPPKKAKTKVGILWIRIFPPNILARVQLLCRLVELDAATFEEDHVVARIGKLLRDRNSCGTPANDADIAFNQRIRWNLL